jgi:hypothetical protein
MTETTNLKSITVTVATALVVTGGCRRFGRDIVFPPVVVERAVRALQKNHAKSM